MLKIPYNGFKHSGFYFIRSVNYAQKSLNTHGILSKRKDLAVVPSLIFLCKTPFL